MESQSKSMTNGGGFEAGNNKEAVRVANKRTIGTCEFLLRLLAVALTLSAAVILGLDKQTKVVAVKVVDALPPINVPVSAKWHYLSAFVYFVVTNAVASAYAALSLALSLANRGCKSGSSGGLLRLIVFILDAAVMGLLFSSNGAAAAIGLLGYEGNSHVQWKKVCNVFNKFCGQGVAALAVSLLGAIAFLLLVVLAAKRLHHNK